MWLETCRRAEKNGSEWWNEEVGRAVAKKREELLRNGFRGARYRAQRVAVKLAVQAAKRIAARRWEERLGNDFEPNKNMFWKEEKRVRKGEQAREEMVKDINGQILRDGVEVRRRWAEYFEQVLNVADVREANINVVGNWRMTVLGDLNERAISLEEVGEAVNEIQSGKSPGLDGFPVECLMKGGMAVSNAKPKKHVSFF